MIIYSIYAIMQKGFIDLWLWNEQESVLVKVYFVHFVKVN